MAKSARLPLFPRIATGDILKHLFQQQHSTFSASETWSKNRTNFASCLPVLIEFFHALVVVQIIETAFWQVSGDFDPWQRPEN